MTIGRRPHRAKQTHHNKKFGTSALFLHTCSPVHLRGVRQIIAGSRCARHSFFREEMLNPFRTSGSSRTCFPHWLRFCNCHWHDSSLATFESINGSIANAIRYKQSSCRQQPRLLLRRRPSARKVGPSFCGGRGFRTSSHFGPLLLRPVQWAL